MKSNQELGGRDVVMSISGWGQREPSCVQGDTTGMEGRREYTPLPRSCSLGRAVAIESGSDGHVGPVTSVHLTRISVFVAAAPCTLSAYLAAVEDST